MNVEWSKLIFTVIAAIVAATWAFFLWMSAQKNEHKRDKKKRAALYVNPFLLACEELQSRLYNILKGSGMSSLRKRHPDGGYAEEILYLIAQYFAWEWCMKRYSPYAQDSVVIKLTEHIRWLFATDKPLPGENAQTISCLIGPFCLFRPEQKSLGYFVRERLQGEFGAEFDIMPLYDFKQKLLSSRVKDSNAVKETLAAIRDAKTIGELDAHARKRLSLIQTTIVVLLSHIEGKEHISFSRDIRQTAEPVQAIFN